MTTNEFIRFLSERGWQFAPSEEDAKSPRVENKAFEAAPDNFRKFAQSFGYLSTSGDSVWFISSQDYHSAPDEGSFAWNEFEQMSLDAALDAEDEGEIRSFWESHLPFMMSVKGEYAYLAIVLTGKDKGAIVAGAEPVFEEAEIICPSFEQFLDLYRNVTEGKEEAAALEAFV